MELDQHFSWAKQSIHNITDDPANKSVAFVKHEDLCKSFPGETLLVIQAPHGTQLEVPLPEHEPGDEMDAHIITSQVEDDVIRPRKRRYQIHLKSRSGPINVLLVNKTQETTEPVVMQVPPTADSEMPASSSNNSSNNHSTGSSPTKEKEPKKQQEKKQTSSKMKVEAVEAQGSGSGSGHAHGTRAITRAAAKQVEQTPTAKPVLKRAAKTTKDSATKVIEHTESLPAPSLRQLSPRKAAQQHLFIRSQAQRGTNEPPKSSKTTPSQNKEKPAKEKSAKEKVVEQEDEDIIEEPVEINESNNKVTRTPLSQKQMVDIDDLVTPDVLAPLLRLSPPPNGRDYCFNLDASEGICDLFT